MNPRSLEAKRTPEIRHSPMVGKGGWRLWLFRLVLVLWGLQLAWLAWQLKGEAADIFQRVGGQSWGEAVRREDPLYRWLQNLAQVMPPGSTYVFLDNYEAGKEIEAYYHLFPRRHFLLLPQTPPSRLFYTLRQYGVSYLLVRDRQRPPGPGLKALVDLGAAEQLTIPGPGLVFRVDGSRVKGAFYD